jgi:hypothetical protein
VVGEVGHDTPYRLAFLTRGFPQISGMQLWGVSVEVAEMWSAGNGNDGRAMCAGYASRVGDGGGGWVP